MKDQKVDHNQESSENPSRRKLLGVVGATGVAAGTSPLWSKPAINAVILPAHAQTSVVFANVAIDSAQEVPTPTVPADNPPTGTATVTIDPTTGAIEVSGAVTNLTAGVVAAHIHGPAAVGDTAPIIIDLIFSGDPLNPTLSLSDTFPAANIADLIGGLTYINVHTSANMPGEIRGQIV